ncbi:Periplasmic serine proteases (ClpP class) [Archaeoglobus sulfaticallidus PM70-1]|uniref:Periplasmic serine proteases (ClpP class) n=1 Tax=Archaeoglobus sulfaticallidus PM70-1 TaxID=387631 RepID=N0BEU4_9EURY|nr:ATP-dependent Clp protease proteolytic subunit [Archaeoglobus sulfaticallidus]AGK62164.1 Periplasmic serine proteases (ClpP class) [Archaeoglobus sulfaticallidus PM70-1]
MVYDPTGSFFNLIWFLFLFYLILGPQIKHRQLVNTRKALMEKMSAKRKSNVITMIHRQESIGLFGIPFYRFINVEDSEQVLRAIRTTPKDQPIDLVIHTPGGLVLAASQIAKALKSHPAKTSVIVPHYAMSGGTLIALAADEIIMDPHAVLGPVDPQLMNYPAPSIVKAVSKKDPKDVEDKTLILADLAEKAINQVRSFVYELLRDKMGDEKAKEVAKILTEGKWTHDYPITVEVAKELGLNVRTDVPEEVYMLMELYPQPMMQRYPNVEFYPMPRKRGESETSLRF